MNLIIEKIIIQIKIFLFFIINTINLYFKTDHIRLKSHFGIRGTQYLIRSFLGFGPGFLRRRYLARMFSSCSMNSSPPSGRPVRSFFLIAAASSSVGGMDKNRLQSRVIMFKSGAASTSVSSLPVMCAAALLQRQSHGFSTSPALTGFNSMYLAAAFKYAPSITNDENRPCHKQPRQPSRKLIARVYLRWASPMAARNEFSSGGTAIRCTWFGIRQYAHICTPFFAHHSAISFLYVS